jgi:hypothetical protein
LLTEIFHPDSFHSCGRCCKTFVSDVVCSFEPLDAHIKIIKLPLCFTYCLSYLGEKVNHVFPEAGSFKKNLSLGRSSKFELS